MEFNPKLTIFLLCIISLSNRVNGQNKSDQQHIEPMAAGSRPLEKGGFMIQQITLKYSYAAGLYWMQDKNALLFVDRQLSTIYKWNSNNGSVQHHYLKEISGEYLAMIIPEKNNEHKYIIGSNRNLRECTVTDNSKYTISQPILRINATSFAMEKAYCDKNGRLIILLNSKNEPTISRLYKVENKKSTLLKNMSHEVSGFRWNNDNSKMYLIGDYGKKIHEYPYHLNNGTLGQKKMLFNISSHGHLKSSVMTSIALDKSGNVWVGTTGREGIVLKINAKNGYILSETVLPIKDLTSIAFGGADYKHLFISSKRDCTNAHGQGEIYAMSGMGVEGVIDNPVVW